LNEDELLNDFVLQKYCVSFKTFVQARAISKYTFVRHTASSSSPSIYRATLSMAEGKKYYISVHYFCWNPKNGARSSSDDNAVTDIVRTYSLRW
jgi:hypothetical protein